MLDARFRPLDKWKDGELLRRTTSFRSKYERTLDILELELRKLAATDIIIEAGFTLQQLRNDGWPRPAQFPTHPGVVLYYRGSEGQMRFPCGTYKSYRDNLHAIALTLENLRAIDRYGVTMGHQQYFGFKALPAATTEEWTIDAAAQWLELRSGLSAKQILEQKEVYRSAYRDVAKDLHPDRGDGNEAQYLALQRIKALLDEHHGLKTNAGGGAHAH